MSLIYPGDLLFKGVVDAIYPVVANLKPGLFLDVGAAAGKITRQLARVPGWRVQAYEPFEGNIPHFKRNTAKFGNVELYQCAVADFDGPGQLYVAATLTGEEPNWQGYEGYSSAGMLIPEGHPKWGHPKSSSVDVVSIDATVSERVRLLKIDVQGGEMGVLQGASNTIERHGIDVIYVEYEGEADIVQFLEERDYVLIDSGIYVYSQKPGGPDPEDLSDQFTTYTLSSGREVHKGPLTRRPLHSEEYAAFCKSLGMYALYTDLVAVHRSTMPDFLQAVAEFQRA